MNKYFFRENLTTLHKSNLNSFYKINLICLKHVQVFIMQIIK